MTSQELSGTTALVTGAGRRRKPAHARAEDDPGHQPGGKGSSHAAA